MKSILNALYDGKIIPGAHNADHSPESVKAKEEWEKLADAWMESHSKEECLELDRLLSACNYAGYFSDRNAFDYGFRLGALIMIEVMQDREKLLFA